MNESALTSDLLRASIQVITDGQSSSGGYIASPNFHVYHFAWLRDGSYCALAMDAVGDSASAGAFHNWVASVVESQSARIRALTDALNAGTPASDLEMLPTRYTLDGRVEDDAVFDEPWPNFQLDGYGTWLFALGQHFGRTVPDRLRVAGALVADYLVAAWEQPCYDYWEEFGDRHHTSTFASLAAGLSAAGALLDRDDLERASLAIRDHMLRRCVADGRFAKGPEDSRVDASLLSLATPFELFDSHDPVMLRTVEAIRATLLSPSGGVRRYLGDNYYGGNPWLMLTAWLGWHDRRSGNRTGFLAAREWVEQRASPRGLLAEQSLDEPQAPETVDFWTAKWGPVADPLLWSHAKYILMTTETEPSA